MPRVSLPDGKVAEFPDGMPPAEIEAVLQKQFPPSKPDTHGPLVGGALDALGLTDRPGARTVKDVLTKPEGLGEHAARMMTTAPLTVIGGALGGPAGAIGTAGAIGGATSLAKGEGLKSAGIAALVDATVAGLVGEGGSKLLRSARIPYLTGSVEKGGEAARAFEWATKAPEKALEFIRNQLPKVKLLIPSFGTAKVTPDEAVKKLATLEGDAYKIARDELVDAFNQSATAARAMSGKAAQFGKQAGEVFEKATSAQRFAPGVGSRAAEAVNKFLGRQGVKSTAEAAAVEDLDRSTSPAVPVGALIPVGLGALSENLGGFARRLFHP